MSRRAGRRTDLRLAVPAAAAWAGAAVAQSWSAHADLDAVLAAGAVAVVAALARRLVITAGVAGLALGVVAVGVHVAALHHGTVPTAAAHRAHARLEVRLVRDPVAVTSTSGHAFVVADATATAIRTAAGHGWAPADTPVVVFSHGSRWLGLLPGQRVVVDARLGAPRPGDVVGAVAFADGEPVLLGRPPPWQRWAGRVRDGLRAAADGLPADQRGLLPGLVLGDVAAMPPALTQDFRATGLTHLVAVSGANVAIVLGAVLGASRRAGAGRVTAAVVAGAALLGFVILVRPSPSVLRAAVMGAAVLVASVLGRRRQAVPVLAAAVLAIVLVDPFLARTPGFAMSVLATAAIVLVAPAWTARLARWMPRWLAAALAVPAAAQLACTPVIVASFGQLTPWAVPANLLAGPAVAPATLIGIATAIAAPVSAPIAAAAAQVAGWPVAWLALVARALARLPGSGATWPTGAAGLLRLAGLAGVVLLVSAAALRRRRRGILARCPP